MVIRFAHGHSIGANSFNLQTEFKLFDSVFSFIQSFSLRAIQFLISLFAQSLIFIVCFLKLPLAFINQSGIETNKLIDSIPNWFNECGSWRRELMEWMKNWMNQWSSEWMQSQLLNESCCWSWSQREIKNRKKRMLANAMSKRSS